LGWVVRAYVVRMLLFRAAEFLCLSAKLADLCRARERARDARVMGPQGPR
jgi:hypothetical protein